jgi:hypothetical protein
VNRELLGLFLGADRRCNGRIQFCIRNTIKEAYVAFSHEIYVMIVIQVTTYLRESTLFQESLQQIPELDYHESRQICRLRKSVYLSHRSIRFGLVEENVETLLDSVFLQKQRDSCIVYVVRDEFPI